jgi:hypothetical protein
MSETPSPEIEDRFTTHWTGVWDEIAIKYVAKKKIKYRKSDGTDDIDALYQANRNYDQCCQ